MREVRTLEASLCAYHIRTVVKVKWGMYGHLSNTRMQSVAFDFSSEGACANCTDLANLENMTMQFTNKLASQIAVSPKVIRLGSCGLAIGEQTSAMSLPYAHARKSPWATQRNVHWHYYTRIMRSNMCDDPPKRLPLSGTSCGCIVA